MVARNKVVISGEINGGTSVGTEEWSVGFHYGAPGTVVSGSTALAAWADSIATWWETALNGAALKSALSTAARVRNISCYEYGQVGPALAVGTRDLNVPGAGTATKPPQCALVATLNTGVAGRSFRGRAYWPILGYPLGSGTLVIEQASVTQIVLALASALTEWGQLAGDPQPVLGVYSTTRDVMTPVTSVSMGNVIDTQRRRRENLTETKAQVDYPSE